MGNNFLLANFLSILKFGSLKKLLFVYTPCNFMISNISMLIYDLGYISGFTIINRFYLKVYFKIYYSGPVLRNCFCLSTPSKRLYFDYTSLYGSKINNYIASNSFLIISTSKGLLTDVECGIYKSGGEVLAYVS